MSAARQALTLLAIGLCIATLAGLWYRRHTRICFAWSGYLAIVALSETLILGWRAVFWTWVFWTTKELLLALLKLLIGLEIGTLAFRRFPGAHEVARRAAVIALSATFLAIILTPAAERPGLAALALEVHARLSHGTALLLLAVGALISWYHVPVHRLHRAILRGLATYLVLFSGALRAMLALFGPQSVALWEVVTRLDGLAYVLLLAYWSWEVWRVAPEDEVRGSPALERRLAWRERLVKE